MNLVEEFGLFDVIPDKDGKQITVWEYLKEIGWPIEKILEGDVLIQEIFKMTIDSIKEKARLAAENKAMLAENTAIAKELETLKSNVNSLERGLTISEAQYDSLSERMHDMSEYIDKQLNMMNNQPHSQGVDVNSINIGDLMWKMRVNKSIQDYFYGKSD